MQATVRGSLPEIIRNDHNLYEGNLAWYFQAVFYHAQNLRLPYHNFGHMFYVMWMCYRACVFYAGRLSPREMRNLLIAALFHDFNHSGLLGDDDLNIARAVRGFERYVAEEDRAYMEEITALIRATEFPPNVPTETLSLCGQIIRDADVSQAFSGVWIQHVVFGLASEWGKKPIEVLEIQESFYRSLELHTEWARQLFPREVIEDKIAEAKELLELLRVKPVTI